MVQNPDLARRREYHNKRVIHKVCWQDFFCLFSPPLYITNPGKGITLIVIRKNLHNIEISVTLPSLFNVICERTQTIKKKTTYSFLTIHKFNKIPNVLTSMINPIHRNSVHDAMHILKSQTRNKNNYWITRLQIA